MNNPDQNDLFEGYGYTIRTFRFDVTNLRVSREWRSDAPLKSIGRRIDGTAITTKDNVRIIGSELETKEFSFSLTTGETASNSTEEDIIYTLENREDLTVMDDKARRFEIIQEWCRQKAPTAFLSYMKEDWEIGINSGWWIEALVPEFVMAQLEQDVASGVVERVHFGVEWIAGLVDDPYAPPSIGLTWGLTKEKDSPEVLKGYVTSIRWNLLSVTKGSSEGHIAAQ